MIFFDRKEEVLEIELTSFGRHKLSKGEFEPVFYSFFDDDVVYDSNYLGYTETQNDSEDRIKETPRTKVQTSFRISRTNYILSDLMFSGYYAQKKIQHYFPRNYTLTSELGIADYYSNNSPAYDINVLRGNISDSSMVFTSSIRQGAAYGGPKYNIPQIDMTNPTYKTIYGFYEDGVNPDAVFDEYERDIHEFHDGFIEIRDDFILLEIDETNTPFQRENFEIELFQVSEEYSSELPVIPQHNSATWMKSVKLRPPNQNLDIPGSSDADDAIDGGGRADLSPKEAANYADYYLTIQVDEEIPEEDLCKYKGVDSTKGLFIQRTFECDVKPGAPSGLYRIEDLDIGEVCD